jgi:hypothetical protein
MLSAAMLIVKAPRSQFHKTFFQHNLCHYKCNASSFDSGYATIDVNYTEKRFYEISHKSHFHKTFFSILYAGIAILLQFFNQVTPLMV